ncbi:MAG: HAMP domain-containing sensor histidine kinase [Crocinitomix sp.]|nr:HAMP domain-containing sensor histidine kinase [Crocinitomix sp.]
MMKLRTKILLIIFVTLISTFAFGYIMHIGLGINFYLIGGVSISVFVILMGYGLNKVISPLNKTVEQLKQSTLYENEVLFDKSNTKEINELNQALNESPIINKEQYLYQRQYSENLSHELLTPLAVIRTKTELILQNPNLRESDLLNLDGILQTVNRLSKVNHALILLSKINNNQFIDEEEVNLKELINDSLENFEDQIRKKQITVRVDLSEASAIRSNLNLLHILIGNLVKNAVFHNIENGSITITLKENALVIRNTGLKNQIDTDDFFQRFISLKKSKDSIGLGLAIVKQICLFLEYEITYQTEDDIHEIRVKFA